MDSGAVRKGDTLADVVELLLDKGVVINADIAVTVGETELLGIHLRAALASFETAAAYGLEFPDGTDMNRVAEAAGRPELADDDEILVEPPVRERLGDGEEESDGEAEGDGKAVETAEAGGAEGANEAGGAEGADESDDDDESDADDETDDGGESDADDEAEPNQIEAEETDG